MTLPEDFIEHDGGECPVEPTSYVETLIRTGQGIGSGGVGLANDHDWVADHHPDGIGVVIAYRVSFKGDEPRFLATDRWTPGEHPQP